MMMMSNGGGGAGDGKGNDGGRKRDHQHVVEEEEEEDHEALLNIFPTGYRFKPTDEELIKHYLYRKVNKLRLPPNLFKDVNIYEFHPSELSGRYRSYGDNEFYFFTPRERKYRNGIRPNRAANGGYWKASGIDGPINDSKTNKEIGFKRSLVFYRGKPPKPDSKKAENLRDNKSDWLMHEYTLEKLKDQQKGKRPFTDVDSSNHKQLNEFILCKLYKKRGKSKKDIKYPAGHDQCQDKAIDAAAPSSIANATSSAAAVVVPEDHHQMHQNAGVAAAVVGDHQYPLTSRVATAAAEGILVPEYQHYMCQSDVAQMGMMPFNYNCNYLEDNGNLSFSSVPSSGILPSVNQHYYGEMDQQQLQPAILPSVSHHIYGEMNQQQLQPAILPSVSHHIYGEMNQQQLQPAAFPSVNHHYNVEMDQQQLQPAILPSVSHHIYGEMNQRQLQPAAFPSVNHHYNVEMNQQQLQPARLPSVNQHGQMNQQHLQPAVFPSVNHHYNVEINQQQLQPAILPSVNQHGQMNQQHLQPAVLPSVNQHTNGQMNQQQLDKDYVLEMFMADLKNISFQPNIGFYPLPGLRTDIGPR